MYPDEQMVTAFVIPNTTLDAGIRIIMRGIDYELWGVTQKLEGVVDRILAANGMSELIPLAQVLRTFRLKV